ncbi:MAG TPA: DUF547 domain-containing protein [Thermoleophilaceae bacterium]|nr:DUF547 domain-containing protein [Thermoleophilaceae bacterium]
MVDPVSLSARLLDDPGDHGHLGEVDPLALASQEARVAFWLNVYNALLRGELAERPRTGNLIRHRRLFRSAGWLVGEHRYTLDQIEHGLLRRNARPPYALRSLLRAGDPRLSAAPPAVDPRVHFALNCGARSCPVVRPYDATGLDAALEAATADYVRRESEVAGGRVLLPGLCRLYRSDFGGDAALRALAARHLDATVPPGRLRFTRFDWTLV